MKVHPVVRRILLGLAAATISTIETQAVAYYLEHSEDLKGKAELGRAKLREMYADLSGKVPMLAATTLDDMLVESALNEAWERIDDRIKQAAREVKSDLPAPATPGPAAPGQVTDPIDVKAWQPGPEAGTPVTVGPPAPGTDAPPPMERE